MVIVSVDVVEPFDTVVGLNAALAPVGAVQLITSAFEVQDSLPAHVVVIEYVAEEPAVTGLGVCVPTVTAVMVSGVSAATTRELARLITEPVPQLPAPPVEVTVTVKAVVAAGVVADVVIVRVDVV